MKAISLKVPAGLHARLTAAAERRGASRSALVREAIEAYLASAAAPLPGSIADRWGDAIGCLEGPGDLSTNPEHLEGFGR